MDEKLSIASSISTTAKAAPPKSPHKTSQPTEHPTPEFHGAVKSLSGWPKNASVLYALTIPWRGYRFTASVREIGDGNAELIVEEHSRSRLVIEEEQETSDKGGRVKLGLPAQAKTFTARRAVKVVSAATACESIPGTSF